MASHGIIHFNLSAAPLVRNVYHGSTVETAVLQRSPDGRHTTFYGVTPEGVRFTEHSANLEETFYIIAGTIRCTPAGGETIVWGPGDLVYWPYDVEMELEYSPGMRCICFFWSADELPDFGAGEPV